MNNPPAIRLDSAINLLNADVLLKKGLTGKNVKIGIIDVGFAHAPNEPTLTHVFRNGKVKGIRDFVQPTDPNFFGSRSDMDQHGAMVLKYVAGNDGSTQYGLAPDALFYLARTDDGAREYRTEQEYFKTALEWMHKEGVRLVNVSLGYGYGFDDPAENYEPKEMDGVTSMISATVKEFVEKYDMIIVTSMGNDGDNPWKIQTAPADVEGAVSVGLVDKQLQKKSISAEGADFLSFLKPDATCFNNIGGTSFAAPVVTGLVACMLQEKPNLTSAEVRSIIHKSGHLYPFGNNYLGYGVPDARKILGLIKNASKYEKGRTLIVSQPQVVFNADTCGNTVTVFHKKDKWIVLKQESLSAENNQFVIRYPGDIVRHRLIVDDKLKQEFHLQPEHDAVKRTTVVYKDKTLEIEWK